MTAATTTAGRARRKAVRTDVRRRIGERRITPYLFILPHLILFAVFILYPFFLGIWISFHRIRGFGTEGPFVGLGTYERLFNRFNFPEFANTLWNTILFVGLSTPLLIVIALFLANLLNQRFRGRSFFRSVYFVPWTLSVAVVGLTWWWMFNGGGPIPQVLNSVFGGTPNWLGTNPWAWITILIATLWWTIGFNTIILLAGMQAIAVDLYEAAAIDGANKWQ